MIACTSLTPQKRSLVFRKTWASMFFGNADLRLRGNIFFTSLNCVSSWLDVGHTQFTFVNPFSFCLWRFRASTFSAYEASPLSDTVWTTSCANMWRQLLSAVVSRALSEALVSDSSKREEWAIPNNAQVVDSLPTVHQIELGRLPLSLNQIEDFYWLTGICLDGLLVPWLLATLMPNVIRQLLIIAVHVVNNVGVSFNHFESWFPYWFLKNRWLQFCPLTRDWNIILIFNHLKSRWTRYSSKTNHFHTLAQTG